MVGATCHSLEQLLDEKQLQQVVTSCTGEHSWEVVGYDSEQAAEGLTGFLGDHVRVKLHVKVAGELRTLKLFFKRVPIGNQPKADFIENSQFFVRETFLFKLGEEIGGDEGAHPWRSKVYFYSDTLIVMPDLAEEGYVIQPVLETFDLPHVMRTVESVARFHASFANYEARRSCDSHYTILQDYGSLISERIFFKGSAWVEEAAKLSSNILAEFSNKHNNVQNIMEKLNSIYMEACESLREYKDTLNVLLHKDLWANNIMFKHEDGVPVNSILIDFQCTRYGPPAFDLMIFLYLTTSRSFREKYELQVFRHYYSIFCQNLDDVTKTRLKFLGYDEQEFLKWCELGRRFGMLDAVGIFPFILMDGKTAKETFDDPETYNKNVFEDRTSPVVQYARHHKEYRERQLHVCEEIVERYILAQ